VVAEVQLLGQLARGGALQRRAGHDNGGQVFPGQAGGFHHRLAFGSAGVEPQVDQPLPGGVGPQGQRRGGYRVAHDLHPAGGGAAAQQLAAGDQRPEDDVGQLAVVRHQLPQALGRDPADRPRFPHSAQEVDVLPGQQVQLAHEAARGHLRHGLRGHLSGRRPDDLDRAFNDHDQVNVLITRLEQHVTLAGLLGRAVAQQPGEKLTAQARRCGPGGHERLAGLLGRGRARQRVRARRRGPAGAPG